MEYDEYLFVNNHIQEDTMPKRTDINKILHTFADIFELPELASQ